MKRHRSVKLRKCLWISSYLTILRRLISLINTYTFSSRLRNQLWMDLEDVCCCCCNVVLSKSPNIMMRGLIWWGGGYVSCGPEPRERTGDDINPIREIRKKLNQKSSLEKRKACACINAEGGPSAMPSEFTCNYRLRVSIMSQILIWIT